jgi:hypothetical protein
LELLKKCDSYAKAFQNFASREYIELDDDDIHSGTVPSTSVSTEAVNGVPTKRRRIVVKHASEGPSGSDLVLVSKALFGLKRAIHMEMRKKAAPPQRISFN